MSAPWINSRNSWQFPPGLVLPKHRDFDGSADYLRTRTVKGSLLKRLPVTLMADVYVKANPAVADASAFGIGRGSFGLVAMGTYATGVPSISVMTTGGFTNSDNLSGSYTLNTWTRMLCVIYPTHVFAKIDRRIRNELTTYQPQADADILSAEYFFVGAKYNNSVASDHASVKVRDFLVYDGDLINEQLPNTLPRKYGPIWAGMNLAKILYYFPLDGKNGTSGDEVDLVQGHTLLQVSSPALVEDSDFGQRAPSYSFRKQPAFALASPSTINTKSPPTVRKSRLLATAPVGEKVRTSAPQAPALHLKRHASQPQGPVTLRPEYADAEISLLGSSFRNIGIGQKAQPTFVGAASVNSGANGIWFGPTDSSGGAITLSNTPVTAGDVYSGLIVFELPTLAANFTLWTNSYSYTEATQDGGLNITVEGSGTVQMSLHDTGNILNCPAGLVVAGKLAVLGWSYNGTTGAAVAVINGVVTTATAAYATQTVRTLMSIGRYYDFSTSVGAGVKKFYSVTVWGKEKRAAELLALTKEPYSIYVRHTPRIYVGA